MKCRALRGVCVGVDRYLKAGDVEDLDPATGRFLINIRAMEEIKEPPPQAPADEYSSQPAGSATSQESAATSDQKSTPAKAGKKEK